MHSFPLIPDCSAGGTLVTQQQNNSIHIHTPRDFSMKQLSGIYTIESNGYIWFEFDDKIEATEMLTELNKRVESRTGFTN
jgi:hypothetical protein